MLGRSCERPGGSAAGLLSVSVRCRCPRCLAVPRLSPHRLTALQALPCPPVPLPAAAQGRVPPVLQAARRRAAQGRAQPAAVGGRLADCKGPAAGHSHRAGSCAAGAGRPLGRAGQPEQQGGQHCATQGAGGGNARGGAVWGRARRRVREPDRGGGRGHRRRRRSRCSGRGGAAGRLLRPLPVHPLPLLGGGPCSACSACRSAAAPLACVCCLLAPNSLAVSRLRLVISAPRMLLSGAWAAATPAVLANSTPARTHPARAPAAPPGELLAAAHDALAAAPHLGIRPDHRGRSIRSIYWPPGASPRRNAMPCLLWGHAALRHGAQSVHGTTGRLPGVHMRC